MRMLSIYAFTSTIQMNDMTSLSIMKFENVEPNYID